MRNIYSKIYKPNLDNLKKAKFYLKNNNAIGIPTETVYGLAGNAYSYKSVKKIFNLKKRPPINPLIIHYKNIKDLEKDAVINDNFIKLYKYFCPGPITFILKKKLSSRIVDIANSKKKTIAVRFPKHVIARKLLKMLNFPLAAPSANISSKLSSTSAKDVLEEFGSKIKFILDGGKCIVGLESTIIDLSNKPKILRQGIIVKDQIQKILKKSVNISKNPRNIKAPGQLKLHYYPGIPVFINRSYPRKNAAFITFGKSFKNSKNYFNLSKSGNLNEAANKLYQVMRKIKNKKYKVIDVCKIPDIGVGLAINERLKKASYKWKK